MTRPTPRKTVTVSFDEEELYLLSNGFSTSYIEDETDPDNVKLMKISEKLNKAEQRLRNGPKKRNSRANWWKKC